MPRYAALSSTMACAVPSPACAAVQMSFAVTASAARRGPEPRVPAFRTQLPQPLRAQPAQASAPLQKPSKLPRLP